MMSHRFLKSFLRVSRVDNLGRALGSSPQVLVFANPRDFGHNMCLCKHNIIIYSFLNDFAQEKSVVKYALRNKELRSDPESYVSLLHLKDTGSSMYIRREREREKKKMCICQCIFIHLFIFTLIYVDTCYKYKQKSLTTPTTPLLGGGRVGDNEIIVLIALVLLAVVSY